MQITLTDLFLSAYNNPDNIRRLARSLGIEPDGMYISNLLLQVHQQINQA